MRDRGMIKWAPFNSVINGSHLVKEIENEKAKIQKPVLSEEQINNLERLIIESMISKINLLFTIYENGYLIHVEGIILKIISSKQKIILNDKRIIYFCEIITIKVKNT